MTGQLYHGWHDVRIGPKGQYISYQPWYNYSMLSISIKANKIEVGSQEGKTTLWLVKPPCIKKQELEIKLVSMPLIRLIHDCFNIINTLPQ